MGIMQSSMRIKLRDNKKSNLPGDDSPIVGDGSNKDENLIPKDEPTSTDNSDEKEDQEDLAGEELDDSLFSTFVIVKIDEENSTISTKRPTGLQQEQNEAAAEKVTKDSWRNSCSLNIRNYNALRLIQFAPPLMMNLEPQILLKLEPHIDDLIKEGKRFEQACYEKAKSKKEYYQLIFKKVYQLRQKMEICRKQAEPMMPNRSKMMKQVLNQELNSISQSILDLFQESLNSSSSSVEDKSQLASQIALEKLGNSARVTLTVDAEDGKTALDKVKEFLLFLCAEKDTIPPTKNWHRFITRFHRKNVVFQLCDALFPPSNPETTEVLEYLYDQISEAYEMECEIYLMSNSFSEYYSHVNKRIREIHTHYEEKRERNLIQQQQNIESNILQSSSECQIANH